MKLLDLIACGGVVVGQVLIFFAGFAFWADALPWLGAWQGFLAALCLIEVGAFIVYSLKSNT